MKRSALTATAVAVLVLSACGGDAGGGTPGPTVATPASVPSSTATATPTPISTVTPAPTPPSRTSDPHVSRPVPTADNEIAGALGQVPEGFTLPDEDRPGDGETTPFTTTVWRASCPDRVLTLASASGITATRIKESVGPEHVVGNGLLVFGDDAAAEAFMAELSTQLAGCQTEGVAEDGWRTRQGAGALTGFGDEGHQVRQWTEWNTGDSWIGAPGSALTYLAREGRFVALTFEAGEFQGDPADLPDLVTDSETRIAVMLDQL